MIMYCFKLCSCFLLCFAVYLNFPAQTFLFTFLFSLRVSAHKQELHQEKLSGSHNPFNVYTLADCTTFFSHRNPDTKTLLKTS